LQGKLVSSDSMEQSATLEAYVSTISQEISGLDGTRRFTTVITRSSTYPYSSPDEPYRPPLILVLKNPL